MTHRNRHLTAWILAASWLVAGGSFAPLAAAGPVYWDWPVDRGFDELEPDGAAVDAQGRLVPGLAVETRDLDGPEVVWRIVRDAHGGYLLATGHGGQVHRVDGDGKATLLAEIDAPEILCLLPLPGGEILAGSGPGGGLHRIAAEGAVRAVAQAGDGYVWAMVAGAEGRDVWLATGAPAAIYRFRPATGEMTRLLELPARNVLDLVMTDTGRLLAGTEGPGLVYEIDPSTPEQPVLLGETGGGEIRRFTRGPGGAWFALALDAAIEEAVSISLDAADGSVGAPPVASPLTNGGEVQSSPGTTLYRVDPDRGLTVHWTGRRDLMTVVWSPQWGWLAGGPQGAQDTGARLYRLTPPAGRHPLAGWSGGDVLDLHLGPDGETSRVAVAMAHPGGIAIAGRPDADLRATSPPLDGGDAATWGRLRWNALPGADHLSWQVRTGNRAQPDASWSDWSGPWNDDDHDLDVPADRYLQWRVTFPRGADGDPWRVTDVSVSAWRDNRPPLIRSFDLERLQGLGVDGMMNGGENVTHTYRSGLQAEFSSNPVSEDSWPGPVRPTLGQTVHVFTWQAADPDGDRLVYRLEYRTIGDEAWRSVRLAGGDPFPFAGGLGSWDSTEAPDGTYEVRLTASDHSDNPADSAAVARRILGPIAVDNTPPRISDLEVKRTDTGFTVSFDASDAGSVLAGARLILPDGTPERLDPVDRICDSRRETFATTVNWPRPGRLTAGPWTVRVEVRDLGRNVQTAEDEVR